MLERGIIPPIADFEHLNSNIDAEFLRIEVSEAILPQYDVLNHVLVSPRVHALAKSGAT